MTTLTVQEASKSLSEWLNRAVNGETIVISNGGRTVLLQPISPSSYKPLSKKMSPREAWRLMQEESSISAEDAENYMRAVREERLASEDRRST